MKLIKNRYDVIEESAVKLFMKLNIFFLQARWCIDMDGRGTFASGNLVTYSYEFVGKIEA